MRGFGRKRGRLLAGLDLAEISLLAGLIDQLIELLTDEDVFASAVPVESNDPFELWEAEFRTAEPDADPRRIDPVLQRLFPDAYPNDPVASAEFRRFTEIDQRNRKVEAGQVVIDDLATAHRGEIVIDPTHVNAWLTTFTNLRLALAIRLDITDERAADELAALPDGDPRNFLFSVYEWLGWLQESLVDSL